MVVAVAGQYGDWVVWTTEPAEAWEVRNTSCGRACLGISCSMDEQAHIGETDRVIRPSYAWGR